MQETLAQEDPECPGATKPVNHNYWVYALEPMRSRACAPQQNKPPQREACATTREKAMQQQRPSTDKNK